MKYEFQIGDYVETVDGVVGYVSDAFCIYNKVIGFAKQCMRISYTNGEQSTFYYNESTKKQDFGRTFKRIGKYDFTEKKNKIERMDVTSVSFDFEYRDSKVMWDKINEIIDYINRSDVSKRE